MKIILGIGVALLVALGVGWAWGASGRSDITVLAAGLVGVVLVAEIVVDAAAAKRNDHAVTLKGTVASSAAKARAAAIAGGTEGVTRVVNQLVVKGT